MTLTKVETQQLVDEFIEFQVNEMTNDELISYASNHLRQEINQSNDNIKKQLLGDLLIFVGAFDIVV